MLRTAAFQATNPDKNRSVDRTLIYGLTYLNCLFNKAVKSLTKKCRTTECIMNNEFENMWKEEIGVSYFPGGTEVNH